MAKQRTQVRDLGGPVAVDPAARPLDTFVSPGQRQVARPVGVGSNLEELSRALGLSAGTAVRAGSFATDEAKEDAQREAAIKRTQLQKDFAQAVKDGHITEGQSPFFDAYYQRLDGQAYADRLAVTAEQELLKSPIESSDNPAEVQKFLADVRAKALDGKQLSPYFLDGFNETNERYERDQMSRQAGRRLKAKEEAGYAAISADMMRDITEAHTNGAFEDAQSPAAERLVALLTQNIDNAAAHSVPLQKANDAVVAALTTHVSEKGGQDEAFAILSRIKTASGSNLSAIPRYRDQINRAQEDYDQNAYNRDRRSEIATDNERRENQRKQRQASYVKELTGEPLTNEELAQLDPEVADDILRMRAHFQTAEEAKTDDLETYFQFRNRIDTKDELKSQEIIDAARAGLLTKTTAKSLLDRLAGVNGEGETLAFLNRDNVVLGRAGVGAIIDRSLKEKTDEFGETESTLREHLLSSGLTEDEIDLLKGDVVTVYNDYIADHYDDKANRAEQAKVIKDAQQAALEHMKSGGGYLPAYEEPTEATNQVAERLNLAEVQDDAEPSTTPEPIKPGITLGRTDDGKIPYDEFVPAMQAFNIEGRDLLGNQLTTMTSDNFWVDRSSRTGNFVNNVRSAFASQSGPAGSTHFNRLADTLVLSRSVGNAWKTLKPEEGTSTDQAKSKLSEHKKQQIREQFDKYAQSVDSFLVNAAREMEKRKPSYDKNVDFLARWYNPADKEFRDQWTKDFRDPNRTIGDVVGARRRWNEQYESMRLNAFRVLQIRGTTIDEAASGDSDVELFLPADTPVWAAVPMFYTVDEMRETVSALRRDSGSAFYKLGEKSGYKMDRPAHIEAFSKVLISEQTKLITHYRGD